MVLFSAKQFFKNVEMTQAGLYFEGPHRPFLLLIFDVTLTSSDIVSKLELLLI